MSNQVPVENIERPLSLEHEFILLTKRYIKRNPLPMLLMLSFIAALAYNYVSHALVWSWYLLACVVLLFRVFVIYQLPDYRNLTDKQKINIIVVLNAANGVMMFCSLYFFFKMPPLESVFQALIIYNLAAGVTNQNVGYKKAYLPYVFLTAVPMTIALVLYPAAPEEQWKYYMLGVLGTFFVIIMVTMGTDAFRLFKGSIDLRTRYADANEQLQQALADSESSNAAKTRFLASASHDLRQPVHALSLFSAALQSRTMDQKTGEIVQSMDRSLQALNKQLEALLDISKLDAGVVKPDLQTFNAVNVLQRQFEQYTPIAANKGIALELSAAKSAIVHTDPGLLEQIINNLIGNALKYTKQGSVAITMRDDDGQLTIVIEDSGIGIAPSELDNIFEEFYQVNNPHRDRSEGLGLGLSIVRRLTRLLGINMRLESVLDKGTTVTLSLPLEKQVKQHKPDEHKADISFNNITVVIVDDEEEVLLASETYLTAIGCRALLARDETEAVDHAREHNLDLVITDLRLRDNKNGIKLIHALREIHADLPAIIISGDTAPDRLKEASAAKAIFLHKPIDANKLRLAMANALRG